MKTYMTLQAKEDQERDEYRARAEAAEAEVARLRSALEQLTTCECGKHLSTQVCPICDNDE